MGLVVVAMAVEVEGEGEEEEEVVKEEGDIMLIAIVTTIIIIEKVPVRPLTISGLRANLPRHHLPWQFKAVVMVNWIPFMIHLRHTVYKTSITIIHHHHHHHLLLTIKLLMSSYAVAMCKHYAIQVTFIH